MRPKHYVHHCGVVPFATLLALLGLTACRELPEPRRTDYRVNAGNVVADFNKSTGRLKQLSVDQNGDGKPDIWSYMDGTRVARIELDRDGDGKVDRWEHYEGGRLVKVGSSSRGDGIEDLWSRTGADGKLALIESDTDRNGRIDKWEHFRANENGRPVLRIVELDLTGDGAPTRRLHYTAAGAFERLERLAPLRGADSLRGRSR